VVKAGLGGLVAITAMALASYFYQAMMIAHLDPEQYAHVMVGLGSFLITTSLGSAIEVTSVVRAGRLCARSLGGLMALAATLSVGLAITGMYPLGLETALVVPVAWSAALLLFFARSLGAAQAQARWRAYLAMALVYAGTYAGLATICYEPFLALAIPGIAGAIGGLPGLLLASPNRFDARPVVPVAFKLAPFPLLINLDLWLAPHWLGSATAAYRVPALLGRPFFYLLGSGFAPAVRRAAASNRPLVLIGALALVPLAAAPVGFVTLAVLRSVLPAPWGDFRLDLLAWAVFGQSSIASLYLLVNGLGHRAGQRYVLALALLPVAFVTPPLAQILVAAAGAILLLDQVAGRAYLSGLVRRCREVALRRSTPRA
jgi:hypothetical protein